MSGPSDDGEAIFGGAVSRDPSTEAGGVLRGLGGGMVWFSFVRMLVCVSDAETRLIRAWHVREQGVWLAMVMINNEWPECANE